MPVPYPAAVARFPRVRQSFLAKFAHCELSGRFELDLALPLPDDHDDLFTSGWSTHRQTGGRVAHRVIARALKYMRRHKQEIVGPDVVMDLLDDELRQAEVPARDRAAIPPVEITQLRKTLRKWARDNEWTIRELAAVEERYEATVTYPDGAGGVVERVITGQVDVLLIDDEGNATVVDHKDTWALPPKRRPDGDEEDFDDDEDEDDRLSNEGYFQQRFYALLVFLNFERVQSVTLREFYIRRSEPREATLWRTDLPDLLAEFGAYVENLDRAYTENVWTPSPGTHCRFCPLAQDCPVPPDVRAPVQVRNAEDAQRVAGEMLVARRIARQSFTALSNFTAAHGPVRVRDGKAVRYMGHVQTTRVERPTREALEDAQRRGIDPATLYRTKYPTKFREFSPEPGDLAGMPDEDVVELFERAAELAAARAARRRPRRRRVA